MIARRRYLALLGLVFLTAFRFVIAARTPLAGDEAYYWVWSKNLQAGYFDHPPGVALWIALGTAIGHDTELGVRFLSPLGAAIATLSVYAAGNLLFPLLRPGLSAAVLLNATLIFAVGAVTATPDTPLLVFWCLALWAIAHYVAHGRGWWWLAAGLFVGLAMDAKYSALLFAIGLLIWILAGPSQRRALLDWRCWAGGLLALVLFLPVLIWNNAHGWVSLAKQGGRLAGFSPADAQKHLVELVVSQIGLATPVVFVLFVAGMIAAIRASRVVGSDRLAWQLLAALTIPGALLFTLETISDRVQGNWPAVLFPTAAIAAAAAIKDWKPAWLKSAAALGLGIELFAYVQGAWSPVALPARLDPTLLRMAGWDRLSADAEEFRLFTKAQYLTSPDYDLASLLAFYAPAGTDVVGIGARWGFIAQPAADHLMSSPSLGASLSAHASPAFGYDAIATSSVLLRGRDGVAAGTYYIAAATGWRDDQPAVLLPRPGKT